MNMKNKLLIMAFNSFPEIVAFFYSFVAAVKTSASKIRFSKYSMKPCSYSIVRVSL